MGSASSTMEIDSTQGEGMYIDILGSSQCFSASSQSYHGVLSHQCLRRPCHLLFPLPTRSLCNHRRRRALSSPPGPPLWPIIGNFLDIPKEKPWIAYADMSKKYGRRIALGYMGSTQLKPCVPR